MANNLTTYGWTKAWQRSWDSHDFGDDYIPARVVADFGKSIQVVADDAIYSADTSGRMTHKLESSQMPKVGDWVAISLSGDGAVIHYVLERVSQLARRSAGRRYEEQIMATNIDLALVVQALDDDFNVNRLKRYLFQLRRSHINAIIVMNKTDKDADWQSKIDIINRALPKVEVVAVQATDPDSLGKLIAKIPTGSSAVVLGSSGVGKSTIINGILGEYRQKTQEIRSEDSKGRHTTTHREMFVLPNGALLIDTPGIRELKLWGNLDEIKDIDAIVSDIASRCKFTDCSHSNEPGCAVREALADGTLDKATLISFKKLKNELEFLNSKVGPEGLRVHKQKQKDLQKMYKSKIEGKKSIRRYPNDLD